MQRLFRLLSSAHSCKVTTDSQHHQLSKSTRLHYYSESSSFYEIIPSLSSSDPISQDRFWIFIALVYLFIFFLIKLKRLKLIFELYLKNS